MSTIVDALKKKVGGTGQTISEVVSTMEGSGGSGSGDDVSFKMVYSMGSQSWVVDGDPNYEELYLKCVEALKANKTVHVAIEVNGLKYVGYVWRYEVDAIQSSTRGKGIHFFYAAPITSNEDLKSAVGFKFTSFLLNHEGVGSDSWL